MCTPENLLYTYIEGQYLENTITRNAFYHVKIYKINNIFEVTVTWGKIGTIGTTRSVSIFNTILSARYVMDRLVDKKTRKSYIKTYFPENIKKEIQKKNKTFNRFSQILEQ